MVSMTSRIFSLLCRAHDLADQKAMMGFTQFTDRLHRQLR